MMKFFKSPLTDERIKISDENGSYIALKYYGSDARVMTVPFDYKFIKAATTLAALDGKKRIYFDFPDSLEEMPELLKADGYEVSQGYRILSVNAGELFSSKAVEKSIDIEFPKAEYVPFRDLILYQVEEVIARLAEEKIIIGSKDIERFDDDLSCVVYDDKRKLRSVILASTQGNEVLVELLFGMDSGSPLYIMAALQGFAWEFLSYHLLDVYNRISMLEVNESITPLVKRLLNKEYLVSVEGTVLRASKELSAKDRESGITFEDVTRSFPPEDKIGYPYQNNINFKSQWITELKK